MFLGTVSETVRVVPKAFLHMDGMSVAAHGLNQASMTARVWSGRESPGQVVPQKKCNMVGGGGASQRCWRS